MRRKSNTILVRRNLSLNKRQLEQLREATEATSHSEVIRLSLRVFEQFVCDIGNGTRLISLIGLQETEFGSEMCTEKRALPTAKCNIVLHRETVSRLTRIRERTGVASDSEVVRCAVRLHGRMLRELANGRKLYLVTRDSGRVEVRLGASWHP